MTREEYNKQKSRYLEYLLMKIEQNDWHGVADCAMDLRDLENYFNGYNKGKGELNGS